MMPSEPRDVEAIESALAGKLAGVLKRLDYGSRCPPGA